jgi:hypothetical protein
MIETTVCLHRENRKIIDQAAARTGLSLKQIISLLIRESLPFDKKNFSFSRIRYQPRKEESDWGRFHLNLCESDYELLLDVRKVRKISVSLFLAEAIELFLEKVVQKILNQLNGPDNYPASSYTIINGRTMQGDMYWKIIWGIPDTIP